MTDAPKSYTSIMVSSTFTDLVEHRQEVIDAIQRLGFHAEVMEHSGANAAADVIDTSLQMVRNCSAYVLVISHKYGQTPVDADRNPDGLSITELEFNEAVRLGRPRLLFLMADDHPVIATDVETNAGKKKKLKAFKQRAKAMCPTNHGALVNCVYEMFASKEALGKMAAIAIGNHAIREAGKQGGTQSAQAVDPAQFGELVVALREQAAKQDIGTEALHALARRVAENVPDTPTAIVELHNALDVYQRLVAGVAQSGNFSNTIEEALNRVREKVENEDFDGALIQGEEEYRKLAEREAELAAGKLKLVQTNIEAARLAFDALATARWLLVEAGLEAGNRELSIGDIRGLQDVWYQRAFDQGGRFEMDVAIALARHSVEVADPGEKQARCLSDLGTALAVHGGRLDGEAGVKLLGEAVDAHCAALEVYTRDEMPVDWAIAQNNLGNTVQIQGRRLGGEVGVALLGKAVEAYRSALEVYTRDASPVDWATTQNNLGNALQTQGMHLGGESGATLLGEAVDAYRVALEVLTCDESPIDWATTQNNLGAVLQTLGARAGDRFGVALLGEAVDAYRAALQVFTHELLPVDWAMTQNNLGNALQSQGKRLGSKAGVALLSEAVVAYFAALEIYTRAQLPVPWAMTKENLGMAQEALANADKRRRCSHLRAARDAMADALMVYTREHHPYDWETANASLARIEEKLAKYCCS